MDKSSTIESRASSVEKILWSIAIPGFGQLLNGKYFKGILLIRLEFMINVNVHLNEAIVLSFQGNILGSSKETNLQWLMFYPCVYMFGFGMRTVIQKSRRNVFRNIKSMFLNLHSGLFRIIKCPKHFELEHFVSLPVSSPQCPPTDISIKVALCNDKFECATIRTEPDIGSKDFS